MRSRISALSSSASAVVPLLFAAFALLLEGNSSSLSPASFNDALVVRAGTTQDDTAAAAVVTEPCAQQCDRIGGTEFSAEADSDSLLSAAADADVEHVRRRPPLYSIDKRRVTKLGIACVCIASAALLPVGEAYGKDRWPRNRAYSTKIGRSVWKKGKSVFGGK